MKKISLLGSLLVTAFTFAQVIIGDAVGTATNKTSVLLEFANTNNKGIILPYVRTLPASPAEGTILLDAVDATKVRVKYFNGISWIDLSGHGADISAILSTQGTNAENPNSKAVIGSGSSAADGVLILESTDKAMVLPTVSDVNNIASPSPGMMVYVNKAGAKKLAVFNGGRWSFWAPN